jgi:hypothetical protein
VGIVFGAVGCGDDDGGAPRDGGPLPVDAERSVDAGGGIDAGSILDARAPDATPDASTPHRLTIEIDYRFDTAGFFTPERRSALEAAARAWGEVLQDDFPAIPEGTPVQSRDPESPADPSTAFVIEREIDDVLVFAGCSDVPTGYAVGNFSLYSSGVADPELRAELEARQTGDDFRPWTGWVSFDCDEPWFFDPTPATVADLPTDQRDFHSVAMHELGHVLGFGSADAFERLVDASGSFVGPSAVAAHGGPVPLNARGDHIRSDVTSEGRTTLMDAARELGERTTPTRLDRAFFVDLGYEVTAP